MTTTRRSVPVLSALLLAGCLDDTTAESKGAGASAQDPQFAVGMPCEDDVCLDGHIVRGCHDGRFSEYDTDCAANGGICATRSGPEGSRTHCVLADGQPCLSRCIDEHTLDRCWSDLRREVDVCTADEHCAADGSYDPLTGDVDASCTPNDLGRCACDSYFQDPSRPFCCDSGCDCDEDCDAGRPVCGAQTDGDAGGGGEACACDSFESDNLASVCCDSGCPCDVDCQAGVDACGAQIDGEACACDSYDVDTQGPVCCDSGCACDVDCQAGVDACGAQIDGDDAGGEEACACDSYDTDTQGPLCCDEGCDCDPDCWGDENTWCDGASP